MDVKHRRVSQQSSFFSKWFIPRRWAASHLLRLFPSTLKGLGKVSLLWGGPAGCAKQMDIPGVLVVFCFEVIRLWDPMHGMGQQVCGGRTTINPGARIGTKGPGYH